MNDKFFLEIRIGVIKYNITCHYHSKDESISFGSLFIFHSYIIDDPINMIIDLVDNFVCITLRAVIPPWIMIVTTTMKLVH